MENKNKKHVFLIIVLCIIGIISAAVITVLVIPLTETRKGAGVEGSNNWMSKIDGNLYLNEITIPGTHDSGANYVQLGLFSKCQASDVKTQLNDGFRYLDVRLGPDKKDDEPALSLYHGFCHCKTSPWPFSENLYLEYYLKDCYEFLNENPSETIIFVVSNERDADTAEFQMLLDSYIRKNEDYWYLSSKLPMLNDCRGKIVLARRYSDKAELGSRAGIEIFWSDQGGRDDVSLSYNTETKDDYVLIIQDRYKYTSDEKWNAFVSCLESEKQSDDTLIINFLSTNGSPKYGHPYKYAKVLNEKFLKSPLNENEIKNDSIWIIVDFSNALLAKQIYEFNF